MLNFHVIFQITGRTVDNFRVEGEVQKNILKLRLTFRGKYEQNLELWEENDYFFIAEIAAIITNQGFCTFLYFYFFIIFIWIKVLGLCVWRVLCQIHAPWISKAISTIQKISMKVISIHIKTKPSLFVLKPSSFLFFVSNSDF